MAFLAGGGRCCMAAIGGGLLAAGGSSKAAEWRSGRPGGGARWAPRIGRRAEVLCEAEPVGREPLKRTTDMREYSLLHDEDFSPSMKAIAGKVDFRRMLEEGCFLFDRVDPHIIERLVFGQKVFASRGSLLIEEGEENSAVFIVGHGWLSISVGGVKVAEVGPGQVVGLYTMLKRSPASADVRVESDTAYLLVLRHGHFMACLDDNPEVLGKMQILLHQRELQNKKAKMLVSPLK
mmetsp:Transcript_78464/g.254840  ORF Transcript_78464/g.254840 Transcript_78464/m.254840 type:complete len:235 (+) Transcript_78464:166-870(+)